MGCPAGFPLAQCRGWAQTSAILVPSSPVVLERKPPGLSNNPIV